MQVIPGQSLTAEPKNAPYENPPEMNVPEEAIMWHLERLVEPERMDALLDMLELGMDVVTLTEGLLRGAVLEGRHSVDVSMIIAPVVHEFITSSAEKAGVDFEEGFPDDTEDREALKYQVREAKALKQLKKLGYGEGAKFSVDEPEMEVEEEVTPDEPKAKGLMARKGDMK